MIDLVAQNESITSEFCDRALNFINDAIFANLWVTTVNISNSILNKNISRAFFSIKNNRNAFGKSTKVQNSFEKGENFVRKMKRLVII